MIGEIKQALSILSQKVNELSNALKSKPDVYFGTVDSVSGDTANVVLDGATTAVATSMQCLCVAGDRVTVVRRGTSLVTVAVKGGVTSQSTWLTALGIGTQYQATKTSLSVTADQDEYVQGAKITLPAGKYIIYTQWYFGSTSSTACSTTVAVGNASGIYNDSRNRIRQADAWWTAQTTTYICTLSSQTDIYSYGSCSLARSGCESFIRAIKVG